MLLTMPHYGGTLAAVRCLGEHGIPVIVAGEQLLAAARWSKHTTRFERCPPIAETGKFLAWLLDFGRREPGCVLYPTCDDLVWLFAANQEQLGKHFRLFQPPVQAAVTLLNKKLLWEACNAVGIETVPTWFPDDEDELSAIVDAIELPVLIKARTHVLRARQTKGIVVHSRDEVLPSYRRYVETDRYLPGHERDFVDATTPLVQRFFEQAAQRVYSIVGFIDRRGQILASRAAVKVLQRTQPVGLGVCFESAPVDAQLCAAIGRLCQRIGYFGAFEVEFLCEGQRRMAIDFNPRFYGQMGFDIKRGLPLPLLVWLGALDRGAELEEWAAAAAQSTGDEGSVFLNRFTFELLLLVRQASGEMSAAEIKRWRQWYGTNAERAFDSALERRDWLPGVVQAADELRRVPLALLRMLTRR